MFTVKNNEPFFDPMAEDEITDSIIVSLLAEGKIDNNSSGFWGDQLGEPVGSKLWTLARECQTDEVLGKAEVYTREALHWLDDPTIEVSFSDDKITIFVNDIELRTS